MGDKEYELIPKTEPVISLFPFWDESTTCRLELILAEHGDACNARNYACPQARVSENSATSFSIYLCMYLSNCLSVHPSIHLFFCLFHDLDQRVVIVLRLE